MEQGYVKESTQPDAISEAIWQRKGLSKTLVSFALAGGVQVPPL
jgi:hypothetical protein